MSYFIQFFLLKLKKFPQRFEGISLIELGLSLLIIGVILGAVFKGQELLHTAKTNSILDDIKRYKSLILMYHNNYGEWPGDDAKAKEHLGNKATNGNGDGLITKEDEPLVWQHLFLADYVSNSSIPTSRFGGRYKIITNPTNELKGTWILLGEGDTSKKGLFSAKIAQNIKQKASDGKASEGQIRFFDGEDVQKGDCQTDGVFNLDHDNPVCVMAVRIQ